MDDDSVLSGIDHLLRFLEANPPELGRDDDATSAMPQPVDVDWEEMVLYIDGDRRLTNEARQRIKSAIEDDPVLAEMVEEIRREGYFPAESDETPEDIDAPLDEALLLGIELPGRSASSTGVVPSIKRNHDDCLRHALFVLNDVVSFERHRVFWVRPTGRIERMWHYRTGCFPSRALAEECLRWQPALDRLAGNPKATIATTQPSEDEFYLVVPLASQDGTIGRLLLARTKGGAFHPAEIELVKVAVRLLDRALGRGAQAVRSRAVLERLMISFLQDRRRLESATAEEILRAHVEKAGFVVHPELFDPIVTEEGPEFSGQIVRITAKLANPDHTMLRFGAFLSASSRDLRVNKELTAREWRSQPRRLHRETYHLTSQPERGGPETIAERVYRERKPFLTLNYQNEPRTRRLFADTRCHLSVPLGPGPDPEGACLGVLSVETTREAAYDEILRDALTLLGARAAVPLGHALSREEKQRQNDHESEVMKAVQSLDSATDWDEIQKILKDTFSSLHYAKGVLGRVDHGTREIVGYSAWGRNSEELSRRVRDLRISFDDDGANHVRAMISKQPVIVHDPRSDTWACALDVTRPFGVFPFVDEHGEVDWTVALVRLDGAPLGTKDAELVERLCKAATRAWERATHRRLERLWFDRVVGTQFATMEELLAAFADFVFDHQFATRCRVYIVQGDAQVGLCQAGLFPVAKFQGMRLEGADAGLYLESLRRQFQPTLWCVDPEKKLTPSARDRGVSDREVAVKRQDQILYEKELRKEGLTEWVEMPVGPKGEVRAKVVLEHKGRPCDRFTPSELRLCASFTHSLGLALGRIREGYAEDALDGVLARLMSSVRAEQSTADQAGELPSRAVTPEIDERTLERAVRSAVANSSIPASSGSPRLGDKLRLVADLLDPWLEDVKLELPQLDTTSDLPIQDAISFSIELMQTLTAALVCEQERLRKEPSFSPSIRVQVQNGPAATTRPSQTGVVLPPTPLQPHISYDPGASLISINIPSFGLGT